MEEWHGEDVLRGVAGLGRTRRSGGLWAPGAPHQAGGPARSPLQKLVLRAPKYSGALSTRLQQTNRLHQELA